MDFQAIAAKFTKAWNYQYGDTSDEETGNAAYQIDSIQNFTESNNQNERGNFTESNNQNERGQPIETINQSNRGERDDRRNGPPKKGSRDDEDDRRNGPPKKGSRDDRDDRRNEPPKKGSRDEEDDRRNDPRKQGGGKDKPKGRDDRDDRRNEPPKKGGRDEVDDRRNDPRKKGGRDEEDDRRKDPRKKGGRDEEDDRRKDPRNPRDRRKDSDDEDSEAGNEQAKKSNDKKKQTRDHSYGSNIMYFTGHRTIAGARERSKLQWVVYFTSLLPFAIVIVGFLFAVTIYNSSDSKLFVFYLFLIIVYSIYFFYGGFTTFSSRAAQVFDRLTFFKVFFIMFQFTELPINFFWTHQYRLTDSEIDTVDNYTQYAIETLIWFPRTLVNLILLGIDFYDKPMPGCAIIFFVGASFLIVMTWRIILVVAFYNVMFN